MTAYRKCKTIAIHQVVAEASLMSTAVHHLIIVEVGPDVQAEGRCHIRVFLEMHRVLKDSHSVEVPQAGHLVQGDTQSS